MHDLKIGFLLLPKPAPFILTRRLIFFAPFYSSFIPTSSAAGLVEYAPMFHVIFWRLLQLPLILAIVFVLTFALVWIIPGSPLEQMEAKRPAPEIQQAMERQYNLDSPWSFASSYLSGVLFRADFGPSLQYPGQRVSSILAQSLPISLTLGLAAMAIALFLGTTAGVLGALRPGSTLDTSSLAIALLGVSVPNFVIGSLLLILVAGLLGGMVYDVPSLSWLALPLGGWIDPTDHFGQWFKGLILPAIALGLAPAAYIARLIRLGLADVMSSDFIRTARAKGLSHSQALFRHALKHAFLPVLSFLGPAAAAVLTGSFVIEKVFAIPGTGEFFVNAVLNKDLFLIQGIVIVYAAMLVIFNLMVDVAYVWLDPRIACE